MCARCIEEYVTWLTRVWLFTADKERDSKVQCHYSYRKNLGKPEGSLKQEDFGAYAQSGAEAKP